MPPRVLLGAHAQAALRHLHPTTKAAVKAALRALKETWPDPDRIDVKRLRTEPHEGAVYRLRVGAWRLVFRTSGADLQVVHVFHRSDGYDWLDDA